MTIGDVIAKARMLSDETSTDFDADLRRLIDDAERMHRISVAMWGNWIAERVARRLAQLQDRPFDK